MGENALNVNIAEALLFVNIGDDRSSRLHAKSAEALLFVNMGDNAINAKSVEGGETGSDWP